MLSAEYEVLADPEDDDEEKKITTSTDLPCLGPDPPGPWVEPPWPASSRVTGGAGAAGDSS